MVKFDHFSSRQTNTKVYIKLTKIQGKNSKLKGEKLKLKQKTQGLGKIKNTVCRKSVEKKGCVNPSAIVSFQMETLFLFIPLAFRIKASALPNHFS